MTKVLVVASGIVRSALPAPLTQLPLVGISLGELGSDLFQISMPLRNNLSIFWEVTDLTQYAKNLLMVMVDPLVLVISMPNSLALGFVNALSDTNPQIGSKGDMGVTVGISVNVGVGVLVGVFVRVGVFVTVLVGAGVWVGAGVCVGGFVSVGVRVGFFEGVMLGSTTSVYVAGAVGDGVSVTVEVGIADGVDVIWLWICPCACSSETGTISLGEQYCPVIVQAVVSSSPVSGSGSEGALIDSEPFAPPNFTLVF